MSYLVRQAADRNFDHETDVAIVGTGAAGLSAALRASSEGAEVLLLEKAPTVGGTTFKAHGFAWFPDNYWMREQGIDDPKRDAIAYMARLSGPEAFDAEDATFGLPRDRYELLEAFYDNAGPAVAAAVEAGVRYIPAETLPDYYAHLPQNKAPVGRCFMPADDDGELGWGNNTVEQLLRASEQRGAKLLAGHRVIRLVLDAAGGIGGLIAEADGREVAVRARRGVVFASGGFGQSPELRRALLAGPTFGACAAHSNTGDFLEMATELGLPIRNTNWAWLTPMVLERGLRNDPRHETTFAPPGDSMIYVNRYGRRTMDEKAPYNETVQNMWRWDSQKLEWPDLLQFMIWDQECQDRYHSDVPANPIATTGIDDGHVVRGETLPELVLALRARVEELEPQTHITLDEGFGQELEKSIARFNEMAANGRDEDFNRGGIPIELAFNTWFGEPRPGNEDSPLIYPLADEGPYYATIMAPGLLDTKGGPVIDAQCRILDVGGNPVPGLFGAGNCVAAPSGKAYWAAGATIGPAITFGYIAGASAARAAVRELTEVTG
ncbi:MAG: FAD-dependent oxidoreductase [Solirubrobacterales bacterium]